MQVGGREQEEVARGKNKGVLDAPPEAAGISTMPEIEPLPSPPEYESPDVQNKHMTQEPKQVPDRVPNQGLTEDVYDWLIENCANTEHRNVSWPIEVLDILPRSTHRNTEMTAVNGYCAKMRIALPEHDGSDAVFVRDIMSIRLLGKALAREHGLHIIFPICPSWKFFGLDLSARKRANCGLIESIFRYYTEFDEVKRSPLLRAFLLMRTDDGQPLVDEVAAGDEMEGVNPFDFKSLQVQLNKGLIANNKQLRETSRVSMERGALQTFKAYVKARRSVKLASQKMVRAFAMGMDDSETEEIRETCSMKMGKLTHEDTLQRRYRELILEPYQTTIRQLNKSIKEAIKAKDMQVSALEGAATALNDFERLCTQVYETADRLEDSNSLARLVELPRVEAEHVGLIAGAIAQDAAYTRTYRDRLEAAHIGLIDMAKRMLDDIGRLVMARDTALLGKYQADFRFFKASEKLEGVRDEDAATARTQRKAERVAEAERAMTDADCDISKATKDLVFAHRRAIRFLSDVVCQLKEMIVDTHVEAAHESFDHWNDVATLFKDE